MPLISRTVPLSHILYSNEYNIHPWEPLDFPVELYNSFHTIGIIHPPILRSTANSEYIIVCGNKRINYARNKKCESIICLVFTDKVTEEEVLNTLFSEQELYKPLSLIEKARFLKIFLEKAQTTAIPDSLLNQLRLPVRKDTICTLFSLLEEPNEVLRAIHSQFISEKMTWEICKTNGTEDKIALIRLFQELQMGDGKQRRFFKLIRDISLRNQETIKDFLNSSKIQSIRLSKTLNIPQKIQHLAVYLQNELTPGLHAAHKLFAEAIKKIEVPEDWQISPATSFERDSVSLTIHFPTLEILQEKIPELKILIENKR